MLQNGLGDLLANEVAKSRRFFDLFSGSGAVSVHVAKHFDIPVVAFDLQLYSAVFVRAIVARTSVLDKEDALTQWISDAKRSSGNVPRDFSNLTRNGVLEQRRWCECQDHLPITKAYGGHYFSAHQAVLIDSLRETLPNRDPFKTVALAALLEAASSCAASPGHTAQPFQPTPTAIKYLTEAWSRNILDRMAAAFRRLSSEHALTKGSAIVRDANKAAKSVTSGDLVFIDPPYSGVQYSRFYHVLETIARGQCGSVSGVGRYPASEFRPHSDYSLITKSKIALDHLLAEVASRGGKAIITFPDHDCSNGLSGDDVTAIAGKHFKIDRNLVKSRFSSLGGTGKASGLNKARPARMSADELILLLKPK